MPKYREECAACHIAYPPGMLPAVSWQRVMVNLPRHYGTDASLDPGTVSALAGWLAANAAASGRRSEPPPEDRITRSAWFVRKHREVAPATWTLPGVRSAANCAACHARADQGDFNEHNVRIPRWMRHGRAGARQDPRLGCAGARLSLAHRAVLCRRLPHRGA